MSIRCIVSGCRYFSDAEFTDATLLELLSNVLSNIEIISGERKGAEHCGELFASHHNIPLSFISPDWKKSQHYEDGKANIDFDHHQSIVNYASKLPNSCLIAFWDNATFDTKDLIERAVKAQLHVCIVNILDHSSKWIS